MLNIIWAMIKDWFENPIIIGIAVLIISLIVFTVGIE